MGSVDHYLKKVRRTFERIIAAPDESLSKADLLEQLGDDYDIVRDALVATEKVEPAKGRAGGLTIRQTQGNRREWGQAADKKAVRFLADNVSRDGGGTGVDALLAINETWPQSRIAEALGVSQPTVSNWLRSASIPEKYAAAVAKLRSELATSDGNAGVSGGGRPEVSAYGDWLRGELARTEVNPVDLAARTGVHINTILALLEGRTERPQQRTRDRIEKALQETSPPAGMDAKPASRPVEDDPWYYVGLAWTREEIDQVPDEPGVYIIHDRLGRPAYVGVAYKGAGGIRARLRKHDELRWTSDRRVASSFSYALAARMPRNDPSMLAKALEKLLIKFMGNAILINEKDVQDLAASD